jgi:hypothetical protein
LWTFFASLVGSLFFELLATKGAMAHQPPRNRSSENPSSISTKALMLLRIENKQEESESQFPIKMLKNKFVLNMWLRQLSAGKRLSTSSNSRLPFHQLQLINPKTSTKHIYEMAIPRVMWAVTGKCFPRHYIGMPCINQKRPSIIRAVMRIDTGS